MIIYILQKRCGHEPEHICCYIILGTSHGILNFMEIMPRKAVPVKYLHVLKLIKTKRGSVEEKGGILTLARMRQPLQGTDIAGIAIWLLLLDIPAVSLH